MIRSKPVKIRLKSMLLGTLALNYTVNPADNNNLAYYHNCIVNLKMSKLVNYTTISIN